MTSKLPINLHDLLYQRTVESERIEYKAGWNPESSLHSICTFANDFHNLGGGYVVIDVAEHNGQPVLPPVGLLPLHEGFSPVEEIVRAGDAIIEQVTHQVKALFLACVGEMNRTDLIQVLALKDRVNFRLAYIEPALEQGLIEMTQPDSPRSPTQKYRLTPLGKQVLAVREQD